MYTVAYRQNENLVFPTEREYKIYKTLSDNVTDIIERLEAAEQAEKAEELDQNRDWEIERLDRLATRLDDIRSGWQQALEIFETPYIVEEHID